MTPEERAAMMNAWPEWQRERPGQYRVTIEASARFGRTITPIEVPPFDSIEEARREAYVVVLKEPHHRYVWISKTGERPGDIHHVERIDPEKVWAFLEGVIRTIPRLPPGTPIT